MTLIPKSFKSNIKGSPRWFDDEQDVVPGTTQLIKQELVADGKKIDLHVLKMDSTTYGVFRVFKRPDGGAVNGDDDVIIGSGQTGPGSNNTMFWTSPRMLIEKESYLVYFSSFATSSPTKVRTHLLVSDRQ